MKGIKTKKTKKVNGNTAIVTIDIGSTFHYVYLRGKGEEVKPLKIVNTKKSYNDFYTLISAFKSQFNFEDVMVGYESSGAYAEPLAHFLNKKPVKLVQINPLHTKRVKELNGNSPNKNDKKDPKVIADIIELGHSLSVIIPEGSEAELRRLTGARERAVKSRTQISNQLGQLIFLIFPEFLEIMKSVLLKSSLHILKNFPDPQSIVDAGYDFLCASLFKISRGKLKKDRVLKLYNAAKNTVGIKQGKSSIIFEIKHLVEAIESKNAYIRELENKMLYYLKKIPYSKSILSIKGIGNITASGIIGEIGNIKKFNNSSEILKLAGMDLYEVSSGKHRGEKKITKFGRSILRKTMYFASLNTVRKGGIMHEYYSKKVEKGMLRNKALIAVARKLLKLIFAIVKNDSVYIKNYQQMLVDKKRA